MVARNIGLKVTPPTRECQDPHCPFHGTLPVRGRVMDGIVASAKMKGSIVVRRDSLTLIKKYRRLARSHSTIPAHLPPCIDVEVGDKVRLAECRAISKTVSFVVVQCMKAKEAEQ